MKATIPPPHSNVREVSAPPQLVVCVQNVTSTYPLHDGAVYVIGRSGASDIVLPDDAVSRRHAIVYADPRPEIEDLGSKNGTWIDGQGLKPGERTALTNGASVQIGSASLFVHSGPRSIDSQRDPPSRPRADVEGGDRGELPGSIIKRDERMVQLYRTVDAVACGDISVLILGETGVGKDVMAHYIHSLSPRRSHAFVKFNSAALPEQLVESELFGYERGAFTGADKAKAGLFETADDGTLFLDEVGDLSMTAQAKLLRVLETGDILRVGAVKPKKVNVRFISATNRDLRSLIAAGAFRRDLFYRLNGVTVRVPALRDRPLDIPPLVRYFAARTASQRGVVAPTLTDSAMAKLISHPWPGNVRELRNVVERAVLLGLGGPIAAEDLQLDEDKAPSAGAIPVALPRLHPAAFPPYSSESPEETTRIKRLPQDGELVTKLRSEIARQERDRIVDALARANGNQTVAADLLGVSRRTLLTWLDAHAIPRPRKGRASDL
jgi:transcriptional regulator with GAF, ATPase, and Fis domain